MYPAEDVCLLAYTGEYVSVPGCVYRFRIRPELNVGSYSFFSVYLFKGDIFRSDSQARERVAGDVSSCMGDLLVMDVVLWDVQNLLHSLCFYTYCVKINPSSECYIIILTLKCGLVSQGYDVPILILL